MDQQTEDQIENAIEPGGLLAGICAFGVTCWLSVGNAGMEKNMDFAALFGLGEKKMETSEDSNHKPYTLNPNGHPGIHSSILLLTASTPKHDAHPKNASLKNPRLS